MLLVDLLSDEFRLPLRDASSCVWSRTDNATVAEQDLSKGLGGKVCWIMNGPVYCGAVHG